ncbi:MAG: hypothetical protein Q4E56_01170 [Pseudomonadota bacterium]|nr:hypothetical protein [Pseudomonadota bacterium]
MPRAKPDIDKLAYTLGLNEYQTRVLKQNYGKYDVCHLVLRGGVLYAPRNRVRGFIDRLLHPFAAPYADLIGRDKILMHASRNVKLVAGGYHCIRTDNGKLWSDKYGNIITSDIAHRAISEQVH